MASQWYCRTEDQEFGPFSSAELKMLCRESRLLPQHQVRQGAEGRWILASQVQGLFAADPAKPIKQAEPLAPRVSDSSLGEAITPQVRAVVSPGAAMPAPPRQPVASPVMVTPVAPSGAIPMGMPVGSMPVGVPVQPVYSSGIPVGVVPAGVPVFAPSQSATTTYDPDVEPPVNKKNQNGLYITVGLAAGALILCVVGAAVGLGMFKPRSVEKKEVAAAETGVSDSEPDENFDPETVAANRTVEPTQAIEKENAPKAKPGKSTGGEKKGAKAKPEAAAKDETPGKPSKLQQKVINEVLSNKGWRDTSSIKSVTSGNVKLMIAAVWLGGESATLSAEPVGTTAEPEGEAGEEAPKPVKTVAKPRYVFVEVSLENTKGPGIVGYKSWNGAGKRPEETVAVLLDSEGRVCPLVSREQTPDPGRRQVEELAMGKAITDVLVFEAPAGDFDYLRVALPFTAIGRTGGALGFHIPRDKVALNKGALAAAGTPAAPGTAGVRPKPSATADAGGQPATIDELKGTINAPPVKKPVDPDAPPSIKDLERDIQNSKKQEAEQRKQEAEKKEAELKAAENKTP